MRTQSFTSRLLAVITPVLFLVGCGAQQGGLAGGPLSPPLAENAPSAKGASSYVYTCQSESSKPDCLVYANNKIVETITSVKSPRGVAAGKDGLFFMADEGGKDVLVYSAGGKKLMSTLSNGGNAPQDVAVFAEKTGDAVAVANQKTVTYFSAGATKPTRTLKDSAASQGTGVAFDASGNCYFAFQTKSKTAEVNEFKACTGKPTNLKITPGSPYGIAFDASGNLYYTGYMSASRGVYLCSGVKSCAVKWSSFIDPEYLNFDSGFKDLWISDPGEYSLGAYLYQIDIASGKVTKYMNGIGFFNPPTGVAAGPGPL